MEAIRIERVSQLKPKPEDEGALQFGKRFTDHMFLMDYKGDKGWHNPRIVPYAPIEMDPAATCLHYGQLIFEGLKAYRTKEGKIVMFRPEKNMERLNLSGDRLCIPPIDEEFMVGAIADLVRVEEGWVPGSEGTSLYIRPFVISTDAFLGVHPSDSYLLIVILSPVGPYYKGGLSPVRIYVEDNYVRAVRGGTGFTKCAGNYAASLRSQVEAEAQGYSQVLWLDGVEHKYVEEVGAMNVFFVLGDEVVTPALNGSILGGITRDSVLTLLRDWGYKVSERKVSMEELAEGYKNGSFKEAFGTGTAAVISPIGELKWGDVEMKLSDGKIGDLSQKLYDELSGIQRCEREDRFGWVYSVI
ncbi:MAG: branched-chain amino acid aminotransferase [Oscillospiraceae bacterium]|nr:branched-chain amino acid aminotransferase [Oscillospiraceae bacterium]